MSALAHLTSRIAFKIVELGLNSYESIFSFLDWRAVCTVDSSPRLGQREIVLVAGFIRQLDTDRLVVIEVKYYNRDQPFCFLLFLFTQLSHYWLFLL